MIEDKNNFEENVPLISRGFVGWPCEGFIVDRREQGGRKTDIESFLTSYQACPVVSKEGTSTSLDGCLRSERERERGREGNVEGELKREKQEKICRLETHSEREREREREREKERERVKGILLKAAGWECVRQIILCGQRSSGHIVYLCQPDKASRDIIHL